MRASEYLRSVGSAWSWWIGELAGLVPPGLRRTLGGRRARRLLLVDDGGADLVLEAGGHRTKLGRIAGNGALPGQALRGRAPLVIHLPERLAMRTSLTLPAAAAANLRQVVAFELERHTPFKVTDVYFAHRLIGRDTATRSLMLELIAVPRRVVDDALTLAQRAGLTASGVEVAGSGSLPPSPDLMPRPLARSGRRLPRLALGGLGTAVLGLGVAALAIPMVQVRLAAADLAHQIGEAKREAEASLKLQKQIEEAVQDGQFLALRKRQATSVSETLATLTRLLPDDTWLTELQITASEVQLSGYGSSATALVALLDERAGFANAAFRSSVTQDAKLNREQFDIAAKLVPRPTP